MATDTDVRSVSEFDRERYLGLWYEIGRLPLKWEDANATHITAEYSLQDDGDVRVDNRCFDNAGKPTQSIGRAKPVGDVPGRLKVSFLPEFLRWIPFTEGDYWVLKLDPEYTVALVGTPDRKNLWLLALHPDVQASNFDEYRAEAERQGFDLTDWISPDQDGRRVTDDLLHED